MNKRNTTIAAILLSASMMLASVVTLRAGIVGNSVRLVYPNPFTDGTRFQLTMPQPAYIRIAVYDLLGRHIRTLREQYHEAGFFDIDWDGRDADGASVPPGVYVCSLFTDNTVVQSVKVVKIKS